MVAGSIRSYRRFAAPVIAATFLFGTGCGLIPTAPDWTGSYEASGEWDLSGPLAGDRTIGDVVAEIVIGQVVSLASPPSLLEDTVHEFLSDAVAEEAADLIDENLPADLDPTSDLVDVLGTSLATCLLYTSPSPRDS